MPNRTRCDNFKEGKSLEEALELTEEDITNALGGLPENKLHCSVLGAIALKKAIENYRTKVSGKVD